MGIKNSVPQGKRKPSGIRYGTCQPPKKSVVARVAAALGAPSVRAAAAADVQHETVSVVFSHTHAAGLLGMDRVEMPGGELIPAYLESLYQAIEDLVDRAVSRLEPVTLVYGEGFCDLARQRDLWDSESNQFVCGFNPDAAAASTLLVVNQDNDSVSFVDRMSGTLLAEVPVGVKPRHIAITADGAKAYVTQHAAEMSKHVAGIESDVGGIPDAEDGPSQEHCGVIDLQVCGLFVH